MNNILWFMITLISLWCLFRCLWGCYVACFILWLESVKIMVCRAVIYGGGLDGTVGLWYWILGDCAFSVAAPTLWNRLLGDIRNWSALENFKSVLKHIGSRSLSQINNYYVLNLLQVFYRHSICDIIILQIICTLNIHYNYYYYCCCVIQLSHVTAV